MISLEQAKKRIKRAGDKFLVDIFLEYLGVSHCRKPNLLSGEDSIKIFNVLGVDLPIIYLMALSNGLDGIDEIEFNKLLDEQKKESENSILC